MKIVKEFTGYIYAGIVGAIAHYSLLILLVERLKINTVIASTIGAITGATIIYIINRKFVFKSNNNLKKSVIRYCILVSSSASLNIVIMFLLTKNGIHYLLSQITATLIILFINFSCSKVWVFKKY